MGMPSVSPITLLKQPSTSRTRKHTFAVKGKELINDRYVTFAKTIILNYTFVHFFRQDSESSENDGEDMPETSRTRKHTFAVKGKKVINDRYVTFAKIYNSKLYICPLF